MTNYYTPQFVKKLRKLTKNDEALQKQVKMTLKLLLENPNHPSLRLHKIKTSRSISISVNTSIRILFFQEKEVNILFDIGTHDEVY